jgi:preprotein translocase subunit SecE
MNNKRKMKKKKRILVRKYTSELKRVIWPGVVVQAYNPNY